MPEVYRGRKSRGRKSPRKYSKDRKSGRKSPRKYSKGRKSGRKYSKGRKSPRYSRSRNRFRGVTYRSGDHFNAEELLELNQSLVEYNPQELDMYSEELLSPSSPQGATSSTPQGATSSTPQGATPDLATLTPGDLSEHVLDAFEDEDFPTRKVIGSLSFREMAEFKRNRVHWQYLKPDVQRKISDTMTPEDFDEMMGDVGNQVMSLTIGDVTEFNNRTSVRNPRSRTRGRQ